MQTVKINGTTIAYDVVGTAPGIRQKDTALLSHSLFFNSAMFRPLVARLTQAGIRCVIYDHRGQGESAAAVESSPQELSLDNLTQDAADLIKCLEIEQCHFVGNSLGGMVGLRIAARRPELVKSVVALGSSAEQEHQFAEFAPLVVRLGTRGPAALIDNLLYIMFGDTSLEAVNSELIIEWREYLSKLPPEIAEVALPVITRTSILEELEQHKGNVPVLAIAGAQDHAYPAPISAQTIAAATGGQWRIVPNVGHSVALERPDKVCDLLLEHFAAL